MQMKLNRMKEASRSHRTSVWPLALAVAIVITTKSDNTVDTWGANHAASAGLGNMLAIPWSQLGARAGADYQGDGLAISPTADGARLRCVFQRLEGEATREGLWLSSTVTNGVNDSFRVVAVEVGTRSTASPNSLKNGTRWNASLPQT